MAKLPTNFAIESLVTTGYREAMKTEGRKRFPVELTQSEIDQLNAAAAKDSRKPTAWAALVVKRALAAKANGNAFREVNSEQEDFLEAFEFHQTLADGTDAAIMDLMNLGMVSQPVRNRIQALAEELRENLATSKPQASRARKKR